MSVSQPGQVEEKANSVASLGPGGRLRRAREAANLTQQDVAGRMRIDVKLVEALDIDNYAALPEPIYVRGYLRSYARLVGLPVAEIVAEYERYCGAGIKPPDLAHTGLNRQLHTNIRYMRWVGLGLVVILVVLTFLWMQAHQSGQTEQVPAVAVQPAPAPVETPQVVMPSPVAEVPGAEPAQEPAPEPVQEPAVAPVSTPAAAVAPAPQSAPAAPAPAENAASATGRLTLRLTSDSWAEVKDATGAQLVYDLLRAGTERTVQGVPPLEVMLGYARGAQVEYNGQPYDHTRHIWQETARFKLGTAN